MMIRWSAAKSIGLCALLQAFAPQALADGTIEFDTEQFTFKGTPQELIAVIKDFDNTCGSRKKCKYYIKGLKKEKTQILLEEPDHALVWQQLNIIGGPIRQYVYYDTSVIDDDTMRLVVRYPEPEEIPQLEEEYGFPKSSRIYRRVVDWTFRTRPDGQTDVKAYLYSQHDLPSGFNRVVTRSLWEYVDYDLANLRQYSDSQ